MGTLIAVLALLLTTPAAAPPAETLPRPAEATALPVADAPAVLERAHLAVFGHLPSAARLAMATAQVRLEGLALPGRNLGAIHAVRGQPWARLGRSHRLRWFASYDDAARAYWGLLRARCRGALHAMNSGDPARVARRLRRCGYYRAPEAWYRDGLRALRR